MFCVSHIGWSATTTSLLFDPCHYYYYQKRKHPCLIQQHHMMEWFPICQITIMIISFALCICISKNSSIRRDGWRYTLVPHHVIVPVAIGYLCHLTIRCPLPSRPLFSARPLPAHCAVVLCHALNKTIGRILKIYLVHQL